MRIVTMLHSAATPDFYEILRVPPDASAADIRRAYKKLVLELHPDKAGPLSVLGHNKRGLAAFQQVSEAYEVLSDEFRRLMYDAQRSATAQNAQLERTSLLGTKNPRGGSASLFAADFFDRSNALWSEQFRERNGKLERRPVSRQSAGVGSRPPTGEASHHERRASTPPYSTALPPVLVHDGGDRPSSRQSQSNAIGARQLFLRRSRTVATPDLPPRPHSLPADPTVENDMPSFRPIGSSAKKTDNTFNSKRADRARPADFVSPAKHKKMSKQERSQYAASLKTLQLFFT